MSEWNSDSGQNPVPPPLNSPGGSATQTCVECHKVFAADEMIRHGDNYVCANCKPVFMQKLAEGAQLNPNAFRYAGFWIRLLAWIVDYILTYIMTFVLGLLAGMILAALGMTNRYAAFAVGLMVGTLGFIGYDVFFIGKFGATPGKMACKIKVVTPEGEPVTYGRAFGRAMGKLLSYFTIYIGCIMAGFDVEKRALHDRLCNTRVVYK